MGQAIQNTIQAPLPQKQIKGPDPLPMLTFPASSTSSSDLVPINTEDSERGIIDNFDLNQLFSDECFQEEIGVINQTLTLNKTSNKPTGQYLVTV